MLVSSILCGCHLQHKVLKVAVERKEREYRGSLGRFYGPHLEMVTSLYLLQWLEINHMALRNCRLGWKILNRVPKKKRKQVYRHTTLPWYIYQQEKKLNLLRVLGSVSSNFSMRNWKWILTSVLETCIWYSSRCKEETKRSKWAHGIKHKTRIRKKKWN